jgi:aminoglycoside phosphotransferase (APT) family kinase protein
MYLRITRGRFDPAAYDQIRPLADEIQAAGSRLPGLDRMYQAVDRVAGTVVAVSTFDTEEHARFSREAALGDVLARLQALGVQVDPPEIYEVTTHN